MMKSIINLKLKNHQAHKAKELNKFDYYNLKIFLLNYAILIIRNGK
jgi:hypothetical protein